MHILRGWWQFRLYRVFAILEKWYYFMMNFTAAQLFFPDDVRTPFPDFRFFADKGISCI